MKSPWIISIMIGMCLGVVVSLAVCVTRIAVIAKEVNKLAGEVAQHVNKIAGEVEFITAQTNAYNLWTVSNAPMPEQASPVLTTNEIRAMITNGTMCSVEGHYWVYTNADEYNREFNMRTCARCKKIERMTWQ